MIEHRPKAVDYGDYYADVAKHRLFDPDYPNAGRTASYISTLKTPKKNALSDLSIAWEDIRTDALHPETIEFFTTLQLIDGQASNEYPVDIINLVDDLFSGRTSESILFMAHRGRGKSTISTGLLKYALITGKFPGRGKTNVYSILTDTLGNNGLRILTQFDLLYKKEGGYFRSFFKTFKVNRSEGYILAEHMDPAIGSILINITGVESAARGQEFQKKRIEVLIFDDILTDKVALSDQAIKQLGENILSVWSPSLEPAKELAHPSNPTDSVLISPPAFHIFVGTPFRDDDPIVRAALDGLFTVYYSPICKNLGQPDMVSGWADRFSIRHILNEFEKFKNNILQFYREYMLEIAAGVLQLIDVAQISPVYTHFNPMLDAAIPEHFPDDIYITSDFAKEKHEKADFSIILVSAYSPRRRVITILEGSMARRSPTEFMTDLESVILKYQTKLVGIGFENAGQQSYFIDWIASELGENRGVYLPIVCNVRGKLGLAITQDKHTRISRMEGFINQGKLKYSKHIMGSELIAALLHQLKSVTLTGINSGNDDVIDALSQLPMAIPYFDYGFEVPNDQIPYVEEYGQVSPYPSLQPAVSCRSSLSAPSYEDTVC